MASRVFGPHVTGFNFLGIHIGATTEVFNDTTSGKSVPESLAVVLTSPTGGSSKINNVANGQSASVSVLSAVTVTGRIDDCRKIPPSGGAPELFAFKLTLRAGGTVQIGPIPIPINVQIDAFDVTIPTSEAAHAELLASHTR
jgi:hypothetical protein